MLTHFFNQNSRKLRKTMENLNNKNENQSDVDKTLKLDNSVEKNEIRTKYF